MVSLTLMAMLEKVLRLMAMGKVGLSSGKRYWYTTGAWTKSIWIVVLVKDDDGGLLVVGGGDGECRWRFCTKVEDGHEVAMIF